MPGIVASLLSCNMKKVRRTIATDWSTSKVRPLRGKTKIAACSAAASELVRPERFELPACCFGGNRSIQLSYGRTVMGLR
jgi:hypothetical protein